MTHRDFAFNWRATMGNADALSPAVVNYLDLVTALVESDGHYLYRTANRHTCAADDPMSILHHVRTSGLVSSVADWRLYDQALAEVRKHRRQYFDDAEIARRMEQADGACPMCGFVVQYYTGDYGDGYQPCMTHCDHSTGARVKADQVDAYLRSPRAWEGVRWPYSWFQGTKFTRADGTPLVEDARSKPCKACEEMAAHDLMEQAIFKLVASVGDGQYTKPGWGHPLSSFHCQWAGTEHCSGEATPCDHTYMRVKRIMGDSHDALCGSQEVRLNNAGLKLFIKPARTQMMGGSKVLFGLRVGGDQEKDYPGFKAFAHQLFTELGVPAE